MTICEQISFQLAGQQCIHPYGLCKLGVDLWVVGWVVSTAGDDPNSLALHHTASLWRVCTASTLKSVVQQSVSSTMVLFCRYQRL